VKVLVADDNPNSRQLVRDILESIGYDPLMAIDGPSALKLVREQPPDLIILDVNMPGMSGFEVCSAIKADPKLNHIPILMLTALADVENRVTGLGLGADDYITKPFSPRELTARIDARLRTKAETDNLRKTQETIRQTFERFVSPAVVEKLLHDPSHLRLGGQLQEVSVLFFDLEGFTAFSERTPPEKVLTTLNNYLALVVSVIQSYAGTVNKFLGDGVMALYNTPLSQADHALRAVRTALQVRDSLREFADQLEADQRMLMNVGIHTGQAVIGNIGTPQLMEFTAIGDAVNVAARLQGLASGGRILISEATWQQVRGRIFAQPMGQQVVKNRREPVMVYEVVHLREQ
jgi:class 3 adenylate cyclase